MRGELARRDRFIGPEEGIHPYQDCLEDGVGPVWMPGGGGGMQLRACVRTRGRDRGRGRTGLPAAGLPVQAAPELGSPRWVPHSPPGRYCKAAPVPLPAAREAGGRRRRPEAAGRGTLRRGNPQDPRARRRLPGFSRAGFGTCGTASSVRYVAPVHLYPYFLAVPVLHLPVAWGATRDGPFCVSPPVFTQLFPPSGFPSHR